MYLCMYVIQVNLSIYRYIVTGTTIKLIQFLKAVPTNTSTA